MNGVAKVAFGLGCLTAIGGPILALILYPKAKWLFAFALIGFVIIWLDHRFAKDPTPQSIADQIERLLTGTCAGWDVDDFEMMSIRDPQLRDLHRRTMAIGGLPEEWIRLGEDQKSELREIVSELRALGNAETGNHT